MSKIINRSYLHLLPLNVLDVETLELVLNEQNEPTKPFTDSLAACQLGKVESYHPHPLVQPMKSVQLSKEYRRAQS